MLRALSHGQTKEFNEKGIEIIRQNIKKHVTSQELLDIWLGPKVHYKCLFSMRIGGLYRDVFFFSTIFFFFSFFITQFLKNLLSFIVSLQRSSKLFV